MQIELIYIDNEDIESKYDEIKAVQDNDMPECQRKVNHNEGTVINFLHYVIKRFNKKIVRRQKKAILGALRKVV